MKCVFFVAVLRCCCIEHVKTTGINIQQIFVRSLINYKKPKKKRDLKFFLICALNSAGINENFTDITEIKITLVLNWISLSDLFYLFLCSLYYKLLLFRSALVSGYVKAQSFTVL